MRTLEERTIELVVGDKEDTAERLNRNSHLRRSLELNLAKIDASEDICKTDCEFFHFWLDCAGRFQLIL